MRSHVSWRARLERERRVECAARLVQLLLAAREIDRVVGAAVGSVALRRVDTRPPSRRRRRWYETRFWGSPTRSVSSETA